jgi:hypothetical protein
VRIRLHIDELPEEQLPQATWSRLAIGLAVALVLLAAANAWLGRELAAHPRNLGYVVVEAKWQAIDAMQQAPSWLFVGDSSCNQGIIARDVADALDTSAYNACTIGSATVADDVWMIDLLARRDRLPEHVVVAHSWYTWGRDASTLRAMLFLLSPGPEAWRDSAPPISLTLGDRLLARYGASLPLASQAISTRAIVFDPARTSLPPRLAPGPDGYMAVPMRSDDRLARDIREHQTFLRDGFVASEWSRAAMDHLVALADQHGFDVHLVVAPMPAELRGDPNADAYLAQHRAWLEALAARSARVHATLTMPPELPFGLFEKADHVTDQGAPAYTAAIIDALREELARIDQPAR